MKNPDLQTYPVDEIIPELKNALRMNSSVVLQAPPGAGKTTRIPLALLDLMPPVDRIVMLEPRRIAAVSAARWMAHMLGQKAGDTVGYTIRFDRCVSASTRIEVVTEGVLTRRLQTDPSLEGTAMVIFDEFHERSIHTDLALALCIDIQKSIREDLKILVMSATIDCGPVARLLNAPVIASEGRIFPVEERYLPDTGRKRTAEQMADAVRTALRETSGDVLAFLPGSGEIRACEDALRRLADKKSCPLSIHPLYGDLPFEEQERAIMPSDRRRIVLATNIAETSLTIEGVSVVIDSGLTRRLIHDPATGLNRLVTTQVSKASAEQRKGRAGRLGPGVCYRLYGRNVFDSMLRFTPPEILTADLSSLVLELAVWGITDPSALSWLDLPPDASFEAAKILLFDLGAVDASGKATARGRKMEKLPVHPRLSNLLLKAADIGAVRAGADIAALISERDMIRRAVPGQPAEGRWYDIEERLDMLRLWRLDKITPRAADPWAMRVIDRTSKQLSGLLSEGARGAEDRTVGADTAATLLLCAYPDRLAKRREGGGDRFILAQGRGVRCPAALRQGWGDYIIAANLDSGEKTEGMVHLAAPVTEDALRRECAGRIETVRRIEWDKRERRVIAAAEERIGAVVLSSGRFAPDEDAVLRVICEAVRSDPGLISITVETGQFRGRVSLMKRSFPDEDWPDLSDEQLMLHMEEWLGPWLGRIRTAQDIAKLDILQALKARLSWQQGRLLDERAPTHTVVPSGHRIQLDYASGDLPVLAVKLQEMFGLADTPSVAEGRVKVLLHLLSPAGRPVQVTQDLRGFWEGGYQQVKKELKGRYPKHPWPEDPWNAPPTRATKRKGGP